MLRKSILCTYALTSILLLISCSVKGIYVEECISDTLIVESKPEYLITAEIPAEMLTAVSSEDGNRKIYTHTDDDYEIITDIFTAVDLDDALVQLTGCDAQQLSPLELHRFPFDEYRYAWTCSGESGELACSGTLLFDGTHYYALSIHCKADLQKQYQEKFSHILSTVGLQSDEGF